MDTSERTHKFSIKIIKFIDRLPKDLSSQVIARQLLRSATSIGANVREAQGGSSRKDFANFFRHSYKSAIETRYWLELLRDTEKSNGVGIGELISEVNAIAKILSTSLITLKAKIKRKEEKALCS